MLIVDTELATQGVMDRYSFIQKINIGRFRHVQVCKVARNGAAVQNEYPTVEGDL